MDAQPRAGAADPLIVTGLGHAVGAPCDPTAYLKVPKMRKYMGTQDDLAVAAAARALSSAGLHPGDGKMNPERVGLYLVVGYIPFESADIDPLVTASLDEGAFSMQRFSTEGFRAVNGLLTFRCLPNMPAFHVSVNFDIQGPYLVTYPGPGQFYLALEAGCTALAEGEVDVALVGGVAHQRNFLVSQHFARIEPPIASEDLCDAAGFLVLQRDSTAGCRARLLSLNIAYQRHNPFEAPAVAPQERMEGSLTLAGEMGAASLPAWLSQEAEHGAGQRRHVLRSRDGFVCSSTWELA
jgi:hypothetical protein